VATALALLLAAQAGGFPRSQKEPAPTESRRVRGLHANVTIRRDERGIPYIEAANEADLYFVQGYVTASDRLWQMDLLRRSAAGELSEIFGATVLEEDKRVRTFGFSELAEQMLEHLSPPVRASLEAYAKGVNAYIESTDRESLALEFRILRYQPRPWRPTDSLVIGKLFADTLGHSWEFDLMRQALAKLPKSRLDDLLPSTSPLDLVLVGTDKQLRKPVNADGRSAPAGRGVAPAPTAREISELVETARHSFERAGLYAEDLAASNSWVVDGHHTVTGKPLLAGDPHLNPSAPSIWHMIHLTSPGLRVAGVTIPGEPGIIIGHNESISWSLTNVQADVQDLYIEHFDSENVQYKTPTGWRNARVRNEEIQVRKNPADPATETVNLKVTVTRHGPVLLEAGGERYALAWPTLDPTTNEFEIYYDIDRARNWNEFRTALSRYTGFPLNFVYGDTQGHIGYWAPGRYPIRKTGDGTTPSDGATDAGAWTGFIPFSATPHVFDPPAGILVTANNRTVGSDYPYYITYTWQPPYRAHRIYQLLTAREKLTADDFREIQADTYSYPDATLKAELLKLAHLPEAHGGEWHDIVSTLEGDDSTMKSDSVATGLTYSMRQALLHRILASYLGDDLAKRYSWPASATFLDRVITTEPREWLPKEFPSYSALFLAAYEDAVKSMTEQLGPDRSKWTWGNLSRVKFAHPLASVPSVGQRFAIQAIPQNGGNYTINRGPFVSMRYIADTSDWDKTRLGIPLGESGDPLSPYWKDQLESWRAVEPAIFPFSPSAISKLTKPALVLAPAE
jgi:penicillin amidase